MYLLVVEFIVVSVLGGAKCLSNVNTAQIGSSWHAAMQLGYPDILRSFCCSTLSPCLVLNSQMPQLILAVGDVARGDDGGGDEVSVPLTPTHVPPVKGHRRNQGREKGAADRQQGPK